MANAGHSKIWIHIYIYGGLMWVAYGFSLSRIEFPAPLPNDVGLVCHVNVAASHKMSGPVRTMSQMSGAEMKLIQSDLFGVSK